MCRNNKNHIHVHKRICLLEGVILVGVFWRPRFMKKMTNIENEVSWVIGNSLRTGIIHKFKIKKNCILFILFFRQTKRHDSGRENQGLKFVAPKMGRIYSKFIAPIQPIRRQCVRVDNEMWVEGWTDTFFPTCLCTRRIHSQSHGIDVFMCPVDFPFRF